ncbi:MAG: UDP-N-acetylglucosamine 2-epimerase (non-hydrolyzing) [Clostridium tyrobutyricum]|uniref:non-hydrolyzing UDP-N-acetylglucosamine 2-epimerase n=1 Tax=Clostridium tyrobutyricum TaxID=1519 RepID=UPI0024304671|nr:UDP-N-acetylglucosamine 2-epimerase (non-hydrolyzing) [Clostridium tyrobutyricum]MCH4199434.1 UDP-N-acetylglucosamine 2-epimerase (non-hydrolyzing) [Clostridium tyrobutyricum]MCH4259865.1 UDP-N-acetylglucosamine 2-epimerase (non-hydrolyzing) [Clostridium tyrobutyricum]MCI1240247.1 UDP-N-acetylglucosamine 2-epimerase (non-hydrolyzing) [Clostridium tyrobutyricum]MCI1651640.1 UDP-N-acetylglucosamine 2-epimerase (non-hydrolyzing) [Clostridium tyrobutyricum]MCI1936437.1 UDP-N-acetylglucosamine 2
MSKLKVMTIVGTRPELIKLSQIIKKCDKYFKHALVHTGQNYDYTLNEMFFKELDIRKPDYHLSVVGDNLGQTVGNIIAKSYELMIKVKPDALLILGDTNSCLSAISAKRLKIPIFHMEAGNRCFDQRVPEEINRKIVDHISDINLTYSSIAREYLLREGLPADRIIKIGSPMFEVINFNKKNIEKSDVLQRLNLKENQYFVVSAHREENINSEKNFMNLVDSLNIIADKYNLPIIVSTHPRTRKMINFKGIKFNSLVSLMKPLGFNDYIKLQVKSKTVISDSGTISEESSILGFKALNIREAHERPEAMEEASVMMVGLEKERILQGLEILETQQKDTLRKVEDYSIPNVSDKVIRIILSYTNYVNRIVWKKW